MNQPFKNPIWRLKGKSSKINYNYNNQSGGIQNKIMKYDIKSIKCRGGIKNVVVLECI